MTSQRQRLVKRRDFLRCLAAGAGTVSAAFADRTSVAAAQTRPDVLFIAIEDVSPRRFGCYGNKVCKTPNIDRFAATALRFDNAHTSPPCCPSRTSLLLCLRPETTKVFGNRDDWHKLYPTALPMPVHFRNHGYETIRCGKIYHGKFEDPPSWTRVIRPFDGMPPRKHKRRRPEGPGIEFAKELKEQRKKGRGGTPFTYGPSGLGDWEELDGAIAHQGIRVLQEKSDKPRLICLGFHATHLPFIAPEKYFKLYPADEMAIPKNPGADETGMPKDKKRLSRFNPHTVEQWKAAIAAHYACTSFVDAQVGRVLDALEKSGRANNTIVVIWSDHGFMLGEHFMWRKGPLRQESTGVVLLFRAPGVTKPGSVCERPVESMDIFPSLCDLCGLPEPPGIEAISMRPLLENPDRSWKKGALMWGGRRAKSIVTERWRYDEYLGRSKRKELFDHKSDPGEFKNLANDPKYTDVVARLSRLLNGGWKACLPE